MNLRPYRYSHVQKDEIEKLIQELLAAQLIRHSQSPFASLVLLVKKKDTSGRLCRLLSIEKSECSESLSNSGG